MKSLILLLTSLWATCAVAQTLIAPCLEVTASDVSAQTGTLSGYCLETTPTSNGSTAVDISGNRNWTLDGELSVTLKPGFKAGTFSSGGQFHVTNHPPDFAVVIMDAPLYNPSVVCTYEKFELGLHLPESISSAVDQYFADRSGLNPFDPEDIDVHAVFTNPYGVLYHADGFYYEDFQLEDLDAQNKLDELTPVATYYPWRIRFAFPAADDYTVDITVTVPGQPQLSVHGISVTANDCGNKGYLAVGYENNRNDYYLRYSKNNDPFFVIGCSMSTHYGNPGEQVTAESIDFYEAQMTDWAAHGGNYVRVWAAPTAFGIEWEELGNYATTNHRTQQMLPAHNALTRQGKAFVLDRIFDMAEANDIKLQLCLEAFFQFSPPLFPPENWENNPYHLELAAVTDRIDFFTTAEAKKHSKNKYRYMVARYGYSTSLGMYEFFNEVDKVWPDGEFMDDDNGAPLRDAVSGWHDEMGAYISLELHDLRHPFTTSFAGGETKNLAQLPWNVDHIDVTQIHHYAWHLRRDIEDAETISTLLDFDYSGSQPITLRKKPTIFGEIGGSVPILACTPMDFRTTLWSSAFTGACGTGMSFDGHWLHGFGYYDQVDALAAFMHNVELDREWKPVRWNNDVEEYPHYRSFQLSSKDRKRSMGWVRNLTWNWSNQGASVPCIQALLDDDQQVLDLDRNYNDEVDQDPLAISGETMEIRRLRPLHSYEIEWYYTSGSGGLYSTESKSTNAFGRLMAEVPPTDATNPDWAYKVYRSNLSAFKDSLQSVPATPSDLATPVVPNQEVLPVFPNPTTGPVHLSISARQGRVQLIDLRGHVLYSGNLPKGGHVLDISGYPAGIYFLVLDNGNTPQYTKIVKM